MKFVVKCKCGAKFSIINRYKHQTPFVCPNCGEPLPNDMSECILALMSDYDELAGRTPEGYKIKTAKVIIQ